jgi:hypothetical protein
LPLIGVGKTPVGIPCATDMQNGKQQGRHNRE